MYSHPVERHLLRKAYMTTKQSMRVETILKMRSLTRSVRTTDKNECHHTTCVKIALTLWIRRASILLSVALEVVWVYRNGRDSVYTALAIQIACIMFSSTRCFSRLMPILVLYIIRADVDLDLPTIPEWHHTTAQTRVIRAECLWPIALGGSPWDPNASQSVRGAIFELTPSPITPPNSPCAAQQSRMPAYINKRGT